MMDTTILDLLGEQVKIQAFKACLTKLNTAPQLDLDALRACIKIWPSLQPTLEDRHNDVLSGDLVDAHKDQDQSKGLSQATESYPLVESFCELLVAQIPHEHIDSNRFYALAEILCSDASFANMLFREKIYPDLVTLLPLLSERVPRDVDESDQATGIVRQSVSKAIAYLMLLKCSYWLPSNHYHVVDPSSLGLLSRFLGLAELDEVAHDTISAFLSLLRRAEPVVVAPPGDAPQSWLKPHTIDGRVSLAGSIIDGSLWDRLSMLEPKHHNTGTNTSKLFRTWFQWVSQAVLDGLQLDCLQDPFYWDRVRLGLLHGHADQRKYCMGIIRQSLLVAQSDIHTPTMQFRHAERATYRKAYEQYSTLFETIVLDRYVNQVQACLPELIKVFRFAITPLMASTLLSAALNSMVQDGVRKTIGNWYIDYVTKLADKFSAAFNEPLDLVASRSCVNLLTVAAKQVRGNIDGHIHFLLTGFLPWATMGDLFTSTLTSTRESTIAVHGASVADVIAMFVSATPDSQQPTAPAMSTSSNKVAQLSDRRRVILGVVDFVLDARGRIFQYSILYLLEGLIKGLQACHGELPLKEPLIPSEADKISRISRLPGLPEIAGDLYSEYCCRILDLVSPGWIDVDVPAYQQMRYQKQRLIASIEPKGTLNDLESLSAYLPPLQALLRNLEVSNHRCIQGDNYAPMCKTLLAILDRLDPRLVLRADLSTVLEAFWEEADRRQFCRPVAVHVPSLLFHPTCMSVYVQQLPKQIGTSQDELHALLSRAVDRLHRLSEGRTYILSLLATSIRRATLSCPELIDIIPLEDYLLRFFNQPPTTKPEFLFEVAAAEKLQQCQSHRTYHSYYGQREWHAYAAIIDLLQRFPEKYLTVAKNVLDSLLEPWKRQRPGVPIISKWKNVLQLQAMLLLVDFCIQDVEVDVYLAGFKHALFVEAWPRYRFLLEWIIARIYYRFPGNTSRILADLGRLDDSSSTQIASLMKLAVLVAPREAEDFSATFMTQLVPFSASPKVQIRHESNYAIPIIFDLALLRGWQNIVTNPAFVSLNAFIRSLDKFQSTPWTIRTLKLDVIADFTLVNIFQGQYLTIESPEKARVAYEDFVALHEGDSVSGLNVPTERIPLGTPAETMIVARTQTVKSTHIYAAEAANQTSPAFFQTKSGFDMDSLHPQSGPPSTQSQRPTSIILVASLIDNPTNLGGLSRISESFGLEALYISDLKQTGHKDFKATSVTSEKHFPIHELKLASVPTYLLDMKRSGYEIVGIEQTDQSEILGNEGVEGNDSKSLGILPKKCVLVLGSEKGGISAEVLAVIDRCVEIRTVGVTRSLNVQTAGGIAVYEWWRKWYGAT